MREAESGDAVGRNFEGSDDVRGEASIWCSRERAQNCPVKRGKFRDSQQSPFLLAPKWATVRRFEPQPLFL